MSLGLVFICRSTPPDESCDRKAEQSTMKEDIKQKINQTYEPKIENLYVREPSEKVGFGSNSGSAR